MFILIIILTKIVLLKSIWQQSRQILFYPCSHHLSTSKKSKLKGHFKLLYIHSEPSHCLRRFLSIVNRMTDKNNKKNDLIACKRTQKSPPINSLIFKNNVRMREVNTKSSIARLLINTIYDVEYVCINVSAVWLS